MDTARLKGVGALGLRELTRTVGVSPNAAYRHFADLRALVLTVALEARHRLAHAILHRLTEATAGADAREVAGRRLRAFGLAYADFAVATPGWYELTCASQEAPPDENVPAAGDDPPPPPHLILLGILDDMVESGAMRPDRRPDAEWACWSAVHGFAELCVHGPLQGLPPDEAARLAGQVMDNLVLGLTADPTR
ncbi:TetR family transcriptional regulator [Nonomuraea sp. NN258]|nr:TetR family transcriptional regulator [Nonomuraea antri]